MKYLTVYFSSLFFYIFSDEFYWILYQGPPTVILWHYKNVNLILVPVLQFFFFISGNCFFFFLVSQFFLLFCLLSMLLTLSISCCLFPVKFPSFLQQHFLKRHISQLRVHIKYWNDWRHIPYPISFKAVTRLLWANMSLFLSFFQMNAFWYKETVRKFFQSNFFFCFFSCFKRFAEKEGIKFILY